MASLVPAARVTERASLSPTNVQPTGDRRLIGTGDRVRLRGQPNVSLAGSCIKEQELQAFGQPKRGHVLTDRTPT